jgi:hypothetical protein
MILNKRGGPLATGPLATPRFLDLCIYILYYWMYFSFYTTVVCTYVHSVLYPLYDIIT